MQATIIPNSLTDTVELTTSSLPNHIELPPQSASPGKRISDYNPLTSKTLPPTNVDLDVTLDSQRKKIRAPRKLTLPSPSHNASVKICNKPCQSLLHSLVGPQNKLHCMKNKTQKYVENESGNINKPRLPTDDNVSSHSVQIRTVTQANYRRNTIVNSTGGNSHNSATKISGSSQYDTRSLTEYMVHVCLKSTLIAAKHVKPM